MAKKIIEESTLSAIGNSIRAKTGRTYKIPPLNMPTEIASIQTGGSSSSPVPPNEVNFYDYDGTVVASYSLEEVQNLTSLPAGPTHGRLTFQGWNYTLEKVKAFTRPMNVGAIYTTDDGKTRIYITLGEGRTSPLLGCCPNGTVIVDWGDGTTPDTLTGTSTSTIKYTPTHNYTSPGSYVISLTVNGTCGFLGSSTYSDYCYLLKYSTTADARNLYYQNAITRIEFGDGVTSIGNYSFYRCHSLKSLIIPNNVTSIRNYSFSNCYSLTSITIPDSSASVGNNAFSSCFSLISITIPDSVTSIENEAFSNCYSLISITIPDSVTSIGNATFFICYSLTSITISNRVTSIESSAFNGCHSLTSIIIPDSVTSIEIEAFHDCCGMAEYHLKPTIPPTLSNKNAFSGIPDDCIVYVPQGSLNAYQTATNWATYASHMQEETT